MPKPHPVRDKFLKYLKGPMAHDTPWVDVSGIYFAAEVRKAIKKIAETDPLLHQIVDQYVRTRKPRMQIANSVSYDSSTVKRKLDEAADLILHNLKMDVADEHL